VAEELLVTFGSYSVNTQVNGHLSMIVDIGAFVNVFGEKLARSLARVGSLVGHPSSQQRLAQPLHIHGVGQGSQQCKWSANMPVAVRTRTPPTATSASGSRGSQDAHDVEVVRLMRVEAPICSGTGSDLPGLLGLRTIEERKGVIETAKGQQFLTFPGPGGYRIVWEPGAIHLPLTKAPSGHLCVELDHFDQIASDNGVETKQVTLLSRVGSAGDDRSAEVANVPLCIPPKGVGQLPKRCRAPCELCGKEVSASEARTSPCGKGPFHACCLVPHCDLCDDQRCIQSPDPEDHQTNSPGTPSEELVATADGDG